MAERLAVLTFLTLGIATGTVGIPGAAHAQTVETFRDRFVSISYGGNDGSSTFDGPWRERGESDGTSAGVLRVVQDDRCAGGTGNCLRIGAEGADIDGYAIDRAADLDGAGEATLRLHWRRRTQGQVEGTLRIRVSGNGGGSWTTLTSIPFAGSQGARTETFDVSNLAGPQTVVRLEASGANADGYVLVDDVEIEVTTSTPTTTTTIPGTTTTTTTPGATTTTTTPGTTTTTTTPGATTTTTTPGTTTTTTTPGVTTTTTSALQVSPPSNSLPPGTSPSNPSLPDVTAPAQGDSNELPDESVPLEDPEQSPPETGPTIVAGSATSDQAMEPPPSALLLLAMQGIVLAIAVAVATGIGVGTGRPER